MSIDINVVGLFMYGAMYYVGFFLMIILNVFLYYKVFNITRLRAIIYSVITFAFGYLGATLIGDLYNVMTAIKGIDTKIGVDMIGAVLFELLWIPTVYAEKYFLKRKSKADDENKKIKTVSFRDTFDFITPGAFIVLACIKLGCCFSGCCYGIECSWGVYSWITGTTLFPIQIFEFATICLILIAMYFVKQTKFYRRGMAGPLTAAMYMFARFCWEFLRYYDPEMRHFFLGLSLWQIFCLVIFIVVVVWVIVLYKTQPSEPMPKNYLFAKKTKNVSIEGK